MKGEYMRKFVDWLIRVGIIKVIDDEEFDD